MKIKIGDDTNEVIKELFKSFLQRYQETLQEKVRGSNFEFDGVDLLYYDFNKISLDRSGSYTESVKWIEDKESTISLNKGGSYIESAKWIKDKKSAINPKIMIINAFNML